MKPTTRKGLIPADRCPKEHVVDQEAITPNHLLIKDASVSKSIVVNASRNFIWYKTNIKRSPSDVTSPSTRLLGHIKEVVSCQGIYILLREI